MGSRRKFSEFYHTTHFKNGLEVGLWELIDAIPGTGAFFVVNLFVTYVDDEALKVNPISIGSTYLPHIHFQSSPCQL